MVLGDMTFAQAIKKKVLREFSGFIPAKSEYYPHPTFVINSLPDYIRLITALSALNKKLLFGDTIVFRGLSDSKYDLLPGLARIKNLDSVTEADSFNDFLTRRPDAFSGLTEFDTLAKMQHYGLPTRLLDFSLNPLVALYFACEAKVSKPGRVVCNSTYLTNDSSPYVEAVCSATIKNPYYERCNIDDLYCNEKLSLSKYFSITYLYPGATVVRPKYWNRRIANQEGVFMVFPNQIVDKYRGVLVHESEDGLDLAIKKWAHWKVDKDAIREALTKEPIDYYKKMKDYYLTEECFRKIIDSYKEPRGEMWDKLLRRFVVFGDVKPLCHEKIREGFCSIIIEAKSKKQIIQDLSYIGIRTDYIYPELEYTARDIKSKI